MQLERSAVLLPGGGVRGARNQEFRQERLFMGPYLQREVEAPVEVGRHVSVRSQSLQNGLQQQLPEGLQHPAGRSASVT